MSAQQQSTHWWQPTVRWLGSVPLVTWILSHTLHHLDPPVYRLTNGRYTAMGILAGLPTVLVTTTGARSGKPRTTPLLGIPNGEQLALIGSNWGRANSPGWVYNLRANPTATVTVDNHSKMYTAHEATGDEYGALWQLAVDTTANYARYKERTSRHIPIMVLTPDEDAAASA